MRTKPSSRRSRANDLFARAEKEWERGKLLSAFRLFLQSANEGDVGAQANVGYFYDRGIGVRRNRAKALYWYRRAYRRGDAGAANNIGTIWRDEGSAKRALIWFQKAARMGLHSSNLEIAKYHFAAGERKNAVRCLEKVLKSQKVSEDDLDQARRMLADMQAK